MKRKILFAFILMSFCVGGIAALQLYYSYATYQEESREFERNSNEALNEAVDSSFSIHHKMVLEKLKAWLYDPSFVKITAKWNPVAEQTAFTIEEVEPSPKGQSQINMSIGDFKEKVDSITPKAKKRLIDQMVGQVDSELKKGYVWFYTQKIGDSLSKAFYNTPLDLKIVKKQYQASLKEKGILLPFVFNKKQDATSYQTKEVNIALTRPHKKEMLYASFVNKDLFLLQQLKWILIGSVVLILITLSCFWYTLRLLLTQHKINEIKNDFINNMTHEINTPLTSIAITAEALKKFSHDKQAQEGYIDIILYQSNKLISLTDEILNSAKLEKSEIELQDTIEITMFLEELVKEMEAKVQLSVSFPENKIFLRGNKNHLARAISNLVDNALKYNISEIPTVTINASAENKMLTITIADNGPGIADEHKEKIFSQFYRVPSGNIHNVKGYGLGLSYVKKVVQAHKGSISVKDNTPEGSLFILKLPL